MKWMAIPVFARISMVPVAAAIAVVACAAARNAAAQSGPPPIPQEAYAA